MGSARSKGDETRVDLVFHIGMPKCASTTLQNNVFFGIPGYLGTAKRIPQNRNFAKIFQSFAPVGPRLWGNLNAARRWSQDVMEFGKQWPGLRRFIASTEFLTNRNKLHPRPIVPFLKRISEEIWVHGRVKVIIVLRNPSARLASSYAQNSAGTFGACQAHFERQVDRILTKDLSTLDVTAWVSDLFDALGQENVCVLLLEEIGEHRFWQSLQEFALLEEFDPASMVTGGSMNQRQSAANTWRLSPFESWNLAKSQSGKAVGLVWPGGRSPRLRKKTIFSIAHGLSALHKINPARFKERERGTSIILTDELRQRINKECGPFHERLSVLLGRDLAVLGY